MTQAAQDQIIMDVDTATLPDWRAKLADKPGHPPFVMGFTTALIQADRPEEILALAHSLSADNRLLAEGVLSKSSKALPQHFVLAEAFCLMAEAHGDEIQANMRWTRLRRRFRNKIEAHLGYIEAMLRQRRGPDAARGVQHAIPYFGRKLPLLEAHAKACELQDQWKEAAALWDSIDQEHPDHPFAAERAADARSHEVQPSAATAFAPPPVDEMTEDQKAELKHLVTGFESLGHNCEFGLMQRQLGAEPLGLQRFAFTRPGAMKRLLTTRFEGIGDVKAMELKDDGREFLLRHTWSSWSMHTRIAPKRDTDLEKLLREQCRHTGFLRKKLIKDLEQQTKVFVYWKLDLTDADIDAIDQAVNVYGPNIVMCVRLFDQAHPAGSFEWRHDRLMVAALDRPGNAFKGAAWNISTDYWVHFCREAERRRHELSIGEKGQGALPPDPH